MKKIVRVLGVMILFVVVVYFLGPKPPKAELNKDLPSISASIGNVEKFVENYDAGLKLNPITKRGLFGPAIR